jgi:hypothetical protein
MKASFAGRIGRIEKGQQMRWVLSLNFEARVCRVRPFQHMTPRILYLNTFFSPYRIRISDFRHIGVHDNHESRHLLNLLIILRF